MSLKVLITDHAWPTIEPETTVLMEEAGAEVIVAPDTLEETLVSMATNVDAIMTCFAQVTSNILRAATRCMVVGRFGVGVDNIDVQTATDLGMVVTYVPDYCVDEVSDHVMALLLTWNRRIALLDRSVKTTGWGSLPLTMRIMRLRDKTLGIVGFGRIGRSVADKARAFGLKVMVVDPMVSADDVESQGMHLVDIDTLLAHSDFVTLHAPLTSGTANMIGVRELSLMKPESFLINCARGLLIDQAALHNALTTGVIAGAGVDVLVEAKPPSNTPLLGLENVIVTPHVAFFSQESTLELEKRAAFEVARVLTGRMPDNLVNPTVISHPNPRHKLPTEKI